MGPSCGHSVCSQCYIDTGDPRCVASRGLAPFRLDSTIVGDAIAMRETHPWITLSEALTYADPSTVQYRAFHSRPGFFGSGFSRTDLAFGHAWYAHHWGTDRTRRGPARLAMGARLATETPEAKQAYGAIVRAKHPEVIGWDRLAKRLRRKGIAVPSWPGLWGMPPYDRNGNALAIPCYRHEASEKITIRKWIASHGYLAAVDSLAPLSEAR